MLPRILQKPSARPHKFLSIHKMKYLISALSGLILKLLPSGSGFLNENYTQTQNRVRFQSVER